MSWRNLVNPRTGSMLKRRVFERYVFFWQFTGKALTEKVSKCVFATKLSITSKKILFHKFGGDSKFLVNFKESFPWLLQGDVQAKHAKSMHACRQIFLQNPESSHIWHIIHISSIYLLWMFSMQQQKFIQVVKVK